MFISLFELFKIGIGPSSSHTMGPMLAATRFTQENRDLFRQYDDLCITVSFYGSLAFTGKGHGSDRAVILGLLGFAPDDIDPDSVERHIEKLQKTGVLLLEGGRVAFNPESDIIFDYGDPLPGHPNGMVFSLKRGDATVLAETTYYSIGGGFVLTEGEMAEVKNKTDDTTASVPYPFSNAAEMLDMAKDSGLSIAEMKKANELTRMSAQDLSNGMEKLWLVMTESIDRGLKRDGVLPGSLKVKRRAGEIAQQLEQEQRKNSQTSHVCNEWLSVYAMAVNEENAAGGRIVTAPTNGAAGVVPAVLRYYLDFIPDADQNKVEDFLLTAAAVGGIIKSNASISGAEVGCQGEVGSASAMAAAGLCAVMGGTAMQIENAAEIALEHHLGMTCDPVAGLVQVPCIERNGLGAVKAVTASSLALRGDGHHIISLDNCIETMRQTGLDMSERYKETSQGGLAVNFVEC